MEETYQFDGGVQADKQQVSQEQSLSSATVAIPSAKKVKSKDFNSALNVTGIAMAGIFIVMFVFYLFIKGIDRLFPFKQENQ
jgi:hypothetical protein